MLMEPIAGRELLQICTDLEAKGSWKVVSMPCPWLLTGTVLACGGIALIHHPFAHHIQAWPRRTVNQLVKLLAGRGAGVMVGESNSRSIC